MKSVYVKLLSGLVAVSLLAGAALGCSAPEPEKVDLSVSAAASLTDAITEINGLYIQENPGTTITPNFAGSGTLQKQIENGAPVDVFVSAGKSQMDALESQQLLLDGTRRNLLNNTLVLIVPLDSALNIASFSDLANENVTQIAIGDPASVPAGSYAQQAFDQLGIAEQVQPKAILGSDVRQVLTYVESGNVDAGIVYATDALTSDQVKVAADAPAEINAKIVYPAAVIKASQVPDAAKDYMDFLAGAAAKAVFEEYGFTVIIN